MTFKQNRQIRRYLPLIVMALSLLQFTACGGNSDSGIAAGTDTDNGTGELSFDAIFQDDDQDDDENRQLQAAVTDCTGLGIATVEAMVYDHNYNFLVGGGPWDCDRGQGTTTSVPAGSGRNVAILAKNAEGRLIYRGQRTEVNVMAGEKNNIGTIRCKSFAPSPIEPFDVSEIQVDSVGFVWSAVEGASEYRLIVSENEHLIDPLIDETTPSEHHYPLPLDKESTYYWQVFAYDAHGNSSLGSEIRSFTVIDSTGVAPNLILDPGFNKTMSPTDINYWLGPSSSMQWGSDYGYNSSPGFRCTISGIGTWITDRNGNGGARKHPVRQGDKMWIELLVKRSAGADGTIRVGIQEYGNGTDPIRETLTDISSSVVDTWRLVTASVTVYDANTTSCTLWISVNGGSTGYLYFDNVLFSRTEPMYPL